jgi:ABC-2 type transport system permease protein
MRMLIGASLVQLPGILAVGAFMIAAVGLLSCLAAKLSWAVLIGSILTGPLFGPGPTLPQWVQDLSAGPPHRRGHRGRLGGCGPRGPS